MDSFEIIKYIADSQRKTPLKVFLKGDLAEIDFKREWTFYGDNNWGVLFCEYTAFNEFLEKNKESVKNIKLKPIEEILQFLLADLTKYNARIEPGAIIRDLVEIGDNCVIMMGAVLNIGAVIGARTMIDMNVVVGGRAIVGKDSHIGAGTVLAGVIEPPNANPVIVGDNVLIGANAVVLEGIKVGNGAVVAAGSVVVKDVEENTVVAGVPAKVIKMVDEKTRSKTLLIDELRKL